MVCEETCELWLPPFWVWHHGINQLREPILPFVRYQSSQLVNHADHSNEENDSKVLDTGAEKTHPRVTFSGFLRNFGEKILLDTVQSIRLDRWRARGNSYIDCAL